MKYYLAIAWFSLVILCALGSFEYALWTEGGTGFALCIHGILLAAGITVWAIEQLGRRVYSS